MKKLLFVLFSILNAYFAIAQDCYIPLDDPSGIDLSSYKDQIESAACELIDSLPANFQNDFKVYDKGFYVHLENYNGFGYPDAFELLKNDITSPYYVLIGKQNDSKGIFSKFWVDVKLPDITSNGCIPNLNEQASSLVEYVLESEFNKNDRVSFFYPQALISALNSLQNFIATARSCCDAGGDVSKCLQCSNPDNIAAKLLSDGFIEESIKNIGNYVGDTNFPLEIVDYANLLFTVNDLTAVDIPRSYIEQIPIFNDRGLSIKVYITKDENVCTDVWQNIQNEINNNVADVVFWHHIHQGKPGLGDEKLFTKVILNGQGSSALRSQSIKPRGIDPVTSIIGALGAAFSDAMIQAVSIYYLDDSVPVGDWGAAFDKVNYGSVIWSGFSGLFVVNKKMVTVALAAGAATAEVTYNAYSNPNYTMDQGTIDFARVFISELVGGAIGGAIGSKLKNVNISWFSNKGLSKLAGTITDKSSAASKRLFVKLGKNLEKNGLTSKFDYWLWDVSHKYANGWETPFEHIVSRHTAANATSGKSFFNSKFDNNLDKLQEMINEGANDWAEYLKGEGTLIDYKQIGDKVQILLDFSSKKTKFGLSPSDFIGVATDGTPINTIRITINNDVKIYNAFPSKTVQ